VVFNGVRPDVEIILVRIHEEYSRWRLARIFLSESFGFPEPVPWIGGEYPLLNSRSCHLVLAALCRSSMLLPLYD
jgi:hypothetical protein